MPTSSVMAKPKSQAGMVALFRNWEGYAGILRHGHKKARQSEVVMGRGAYVLHVDWRARNDCYAF